MKIILIDNYIHDEGVIYNRNSIATLKNLEEISLNLDKNELTYGRIQYIQQFSEYHI